MPSLAPAKELSEPDDIEFIGEQGSCTVYLDNGQISAIYTLSLCQYAIIGQADEIKSSTWTFYDGYGDEWLSGWDFLNEYYGAGTPGNGAILVALAWCVKNNTEPEATTLYQDNQYAAGMWKFGENKFCPYAKADVTFAPSAPPPAECDKKTWFKDGDGDGKGDPYDHVEACTPPLGYVASSGDYCDATYGWYDPIQAGKDEDGDGYIVKPEKVCPINAGGELPKPWVASWKGIDCSGWDNNPSVNPETQWDADFDQDGYLALDDKVSGCDALGSPQHFVHSENTVKDCDDNANWKHPKAEWCKDSDWDGYCAEIEIQCEDPGKEWYNVEWQKKNKGKEFKPGDCDDYANWKYPGVIWVPDADADGYYPAENFWKTQCQDPDVDGSGAAACVKGGTKYCWDPKKTTTDQPGDCDDTADFKHPKAEWCKDADGDGYCAEKETQCKDPDKPGSNQWLNVAWHKENQGKDFKPGDCDDGNNKILDIRYLFRDMDGDGLGDPVLTKAVNCAESGLTSEPGWVERPNDLNDAIPTASIPEQVGLMGREFLLTEAEPTLCETQAGDKAADCVQQAPLCYSNAMGVVACLPFDFWSKYCPEQGKQGDPWYSENPYGTHHPILTKADFKLAAVPIISGDPLAAAACITRNLPDDYPGPLWAILQIIETGERFALVFSDASSSLFILFPEQGSNYQLNLEKYYGASVASQVDWFQQGLDHYSATTPVIALTQADFWLHFGKIISYDISENSVLWDSVLDAKIPAFGAGTFQVFKNMVIGCPERGSTPQEPWLTVTDPSFIAAAVPDCRRGLEEVIIEQDFDHDGIKDLVEQNMPGLDPELGKLAAADPHIIPTIFGRTQLDDTSLILTDVISMLLPYSPDQIGLWNQGKMLAHVLVEPVYLRAQEFMDLFDIEAVEEILTIAHWHALIEQAKPLHMWKAKKGPKALFSSPVYASFLERGPWGLSSGCGAEGSDICVDLEKILSDMADPMSKLDVSDVTLVPSQELQVTRITLVIAEVLIHEVLHNHFNSADLATEHAIIYAITGEMVWPQAID